MAASRLRKSAKTVAKKHVAKKLGAYRAKRDFSQTSEPVASEASPGRRLVVQHHFARREHFDLRLEIDGVFASWAVTRGPSANPKDRRLAVRTEDHPLEYADFEGTIPAKNYGAGTVILWEKTSYDPLNGDPAQALRRGEIKFLSHGQRMRGAWVLVRMKPNEEKRENWLLIKERDAFAEGDDSLAQRYPASVASGRDRSGGERGPVLEKPKRVAGDAPPPFRTPCLCQPADSPPDAPGWLFEMKYDGYRLQIARGGDQAKIYTRSGLDWTARFPLLARAAAGLRCASALLDGEAVVFNAAGISDFPALVAALEAESAGRVEFVAFDLLELNGEDIAASPLARRKNMLRGLLPEHGRLRYADHLFSEGAQMFSAVVARGGEGVVAKREDAPYRSGRSGDWLKIKATSAEDVEILGHMPSTKGEAFASLLAARQGADGLVYLGRIGSGFARWRGPLAERVATARDAKAAKPKVINATKLPRAAVYWRSPLPAEVAFSGWTGDGQMRHARLQRLREDLSPARKGNSPPPKITHADRIVFPDCGVTKGDVAAYYAAVAERIAPHLEDRVVSLLRAPEGIAEETFFQRHPLKGMTKGVVAVEEDPNKPPYFALDGALGLMTAAQFGAIEFHGRMTRTDAPEAPDRLAFDLDPDPSVSFATVREAAVTIRDALEAVGLASFPLLSGGKGVHVVAPLDRKNAQADVEAFTAFFAALLTREHRQRFVATMSKRARKGKIFIDWMRNQRHATAILPWSLRARPGAPVATPVDWKELRQIDCAAAFTISTAPARKDPWAAEFFSTRQSIPKAALDAAKAAR